MSPKIKQSSPSTFAKKLVELRKSRQMTQEQFAEEIGLSRGTIAYYEANAKNPRIQTIYRIAGFFNVPPERLIAEGDDDGKPGPASRLEQLFRNIKHLSAYKQRMVMGVLEAFLKSEKVIENN